MAELLIIGASRGIGLETVSAALRAGHNVRALARSAASIPVQDAGLDKVSGDALDSNTIRNALQGVDVVIQTLGVDIPSRHLRTHNTLLGINAHPGRRHAGRGRETAGRRDRSRRGR